MIGGWRCGESVQLACDHIDQFAILVLAVWPYLDVPVCLMP